MNEIELGNMIAFLRGNLTLKNLLKYTKIETINNKNERKPLKFLLEQLVNIKEESYKGWQFRGGKNNIKGYYIDKIKKGEKTLEELKGFLSNGTYYRIKKELKKSCIERN